MDDLGVLPGEIPPLERVNKCVPSMDICLNLAPVYHPLPLHPRNNWIYSILSFQPEELSNAGRSRPSWAETQTCDRRARLTVLQPGLTHGGILRVFADPHVLNSTITRIACIKARL